MKKYVAEFMGTAILVFCGVGAAMVTGNVVAGALGFGLALLVLCFIIGPISGCHVNPAVSLAMFVGGRMDAKTMFFYMGVQVLGAIFGAALLFGIMEIASLEVIGTMWGSNSHREIAAISQGTARGIVAALLIEFTLTFIFILTIMFVTAKGSTAGNFAGVIIGLALALVHIIGIHLTGTSVNPARSIGTAIMGGAEPLAQVWVFIIAPLFGGVAAALVYGYFAKKESDEQAS